MGIVIFVFAHFASVVLVIEDFFGSSQQEVQLWGAQLLRCFFSSVLTFPHLAVGTPTPLLKLLLELLPRGVIEGLNMCYNVEQREQNATKAVEKIPR